MSFFSFITDRTKEPIRKPPPTTVPPNPPPLESYDKHGEYQRALDRRLNQAIQPPPQHKYNGMVAVIVPIRLAITIGMDCEGQGNITRCLEITIPASEFESLFAALNGQLVQCWIQSVRPVECHTSMEEHHPAPKAHKNATGLDTELDTDPATDNRNWRD